MLIIVHSCVFFNTICFVVDIVSLSLGLKCKFSFKKEEFWNLLFHIYRELVFYLYYYGWWNLSITDNANRYTVIFVNTNNLLGGRNPSCPHYGFPLAPRIFSGQQRKYSPVNYDSVTAYIVHKGAAESNKCMTPKINHWLHYSTATVSQWHFYFFFTN